MIKKKTNYLFIFTIILFLIFISLYLSQINGYYEYKNYSKMTLTKEAMEQFENDVDEGKNVIFTDYLDNTYVDYSNNMSNLGNKTSEIIEYIFKKGLKKSYKIISALFID